MSSEQELPEEEHHLRLSIEFHSVKDLQNPCNLYFKFHNQLLGTGKTHSVQVQRLTETRIENAFQAHELYMTKSQLYPSLSSTPLLIELWEADKYASDSQLGAATVQLDELLRAPLKRTNGTVLRVLDCWLAAVHNDEKFAQIRVILYLEDLGAKQSGAVLAQAQGPTDYQAA